MPPWAQFQLMILAQPSTLYGLTCPCKTWQGPMQPSDGAVDCVVSIRLSFMRTFPSRYLEGVAIPHASLEPACKVPRGDPESHSLELHSVEQGLAK